MHRSKALKCLEDEQVAWAREHAVLAPIKRAHERCHFTRIRLRGAAVRAAGRAPHALALERRLSSQPVRDDLRAALTGGLRKVVLWTDQHGGREALFEAEPFDPFFNVNTPDDLARAEGLLR